MARAWSFPPFRLEVDSGSLWRDDTLKLLPPKAVAAASTMGQASHISPCWKPWGNWAGGRTVQSWWPCCASCRRRGWCTYQRWCRKRHTRRCSGGPEGRRGSVGYASWPRRWRRWQPRGRCCWRWKTYTGVRGRRGTGWWPWRGGGRRHGYWCWGRIGRRSRWRRPIRCGNRPLKTRRCWRPPASLGWCFPLPLAQRALALARTHRERGVEAYALRLLGELASSGAASDVVEAETYYRQAMTLARDFGMRPLLAHSALGVGTLYLRTGRQAEAQAMLSTAVDLFAAMGMASWETHARTIFQQCAHDCTG
jgi:hypothetical protein